MELCWCHNVLHYTRRFGTWILLSLVIPQIALAATPAGTIISNSATVNYTISGPPEAPITSVPATFQVDELIQPVLTWQDATPVAASSPGVNDALTFLLTNGGNGQEAFGLSRINGPLPLPAGNYTPLNGTIGSIYLENGLQPGFQGSGPNTDTPFAPGVNDPDLGAGMGQIIYVISDTPVVPDNTQGEVQLTVASLTAGVAGAAPGTGFAGLGQGGSSAVVGVTSAQASATGSYIATGARLALSKSVISVLDPNGGTETMPGSLVTYQISVALTGTGTATNILISDPLPAATTFVPGSISVDAVAKTDAVDGDNADFSANTVSVSLGDVAAPANIVITFRATIN